MPGPAIMAHQYRQAAGNSIARIIRGGAFQEFLGTNGITGTSASPMNDGDFLIRSTMCRFRGLIYAATRTEIVVLNPITGLWETSFTFLVPLGENPCQLLTAGRFIVGCYSQDSGGGNRTVVYLRFDGIMPGDWVVAISGFGLDNPPTPLKLFEYKGSVYGRAGVDGITTSRVWTLAVESNVFTTTLVVGAPDTHIESEIFSVDDRLFLYYQGTAGNPAKVFEFVFGTWVLQATVLPVITQQNGSSSHFRIGADVFLFTGSSAGGNRLVCLKFSVLTPGGALQVADITAAIPVLLRVGTTIGVASQYRLSCYVDSQTVPGSATGYVLFLPIAAGSAVPTLLQWVDEFTEMTIAASPDTSGTSGYSIASFGGGELINGISTPLSKLISTSDQGSAQGPVGVLFTFSCWGDPLIIPHGAVTGTITVGDVATQVGSGATGVVIQTSANETWLKNATGVWTDTQLFNTVGGPGGSATQNAVATGGSADKTIDVRFHLGAGSIGIGVPITGLATMVPGSLVDSGGGPAVLVGNQIQQVTADGRDYTAEWDFFADGIPEGTIDQIQLSTLRP